MSLLPDTADPSPLEIQMFPDWGGASGLWHLGALDPVDHLGLDEDLARRLRTWIVYWQDHTDTVEGGWDVPESRRAFVAEGYALAAELVRALPPHVRLVPRFGSPHKD